MVSHWTSSCWMRRDKTPATLTPQHHGTQWQPWLSTVLNFPNFSLTTIVDWSTWYKPHTYPMSPPPRQVWDLHNTTTTTHFQHSDDAQKSGIIKKTVNSISPNKERENKIAGNKTQRLLFHPKTKRSPTQSLFVCLSVFPLARNRIPNFFLPTQGRNLEAD